MENNKKNLYRICFTRIARIVVAIFIFCEICKTLNYIYVDADAYSFERIMWHHFYHDIKDIEYIYIGSSHVYCGINPMLLDELNDSYNFNMASGSQTLASSYFLLREAGKQCPLSHVYLELYYDVSTKSNGVFKSDPINISPENSWRNLDYMKPSYNKIIYILSTNKTDQYIDIFFPFCRYRTMLNDYNYIKDNIANKRKDEYITYSKRYDLPDGTGYSEYRQQGYYYSTGILSDNARIFEQSKTLEENPMGEESEKYLRKIIEYCRSKNIAITLFIAPITELQLISTENYDNYINHVQMIANECNVEFYDFNLAKEDYLPIQKGKYFKDIGHLNSSGANMFTPFFYKVVSGNKDENEVYFYHSYSEKLAIQSPELYGIYYRYSNVEDNLPENVRIFSIASNRESGMEYKIIMTPNKGEQYLIQDFAENKIFTAPISEHGICTIIARIKEQPDEIQTLKIDY